MLSLLTTSTCTIKRAAITSGARNPATAPTVLSGLACTAPSMADVSNLGAYVQDGTIQSVSQVMETVITGAQDIRPNDLAVIAGVTYLVIAVAPWPTIPGTHVTMERVLQ